MNFITRKFLIETLFLSVRGGSRNLRVFGKLLELRRVVQQPLREKSTSKCQYPVEKSTSIRQLPVISIQLSASRSQHRSQFPNVNFQKSAFKRQLPNDFPQPLTHHTTRLLLLYLMVLLVPGQLFLVYCHWCCWCWCICWVDARGRGQRSGRGVPGPKPFSLLYYFQA